MSSMFDGAYRRAVMIALGLAAAGTAVAQVPIGQISSDGITIKGKVADDFGGKFVLADESGRILVEPRGGLPADIWFGAGEMVSVTGLPRGRTFEAIRIAREQGEVVFTASAQPVAPSPGMPPTPSMSAGGSLPPDAMPPPLADPLRTAALPFPGSVGQAQIDTVLKANGLTAIGVPDRKKKHIEIPARDAGGTNVVVSLDLFGRMWEVEDADESEAPVPVRITSALQAMEVVRQAGLQPSNQVERREEHFEVMAQSPAGELLEIHLDMSGRIYKRAWIR